MSGPKRRTYSKKRSWSFALEMQQVLHDKVMDPTTNPQHLANLARAWDVLEDRKRVLRGRGLPKAVPAGAWRRKSRAKIDPEKPVLRPPMPDSVKPSDATQPTIA